MAFDLASLCRLTWWEVTVLFPFACKNLSPSEPLRAHPQHAYKHTHRHTAQAVLPYSPNHKLFEVLGAVGVWMADNMN